MIQRSARLLVVRQRLASAAEVQSLLLTFLPPTGDLYRIEPVYLPASAVGGNFVHVLERADGARVVLVGDASGKGRKAAVLVSATVGILRRETSSSPAAILAGLNEGLLGRTAHPSPYCDGHELEVEADRPLGIAPGVQYTELNTRYERLTLVSDGVLEAENAQRKLFGFDRTRKISGQSAQTYGKTTTSP